MQTIQHNLNKCSVKMQRLIKERNKLKILIKNLTLDQIDLNCTVKYYNSKYEHSLVQYISDLLYIIKNI